MGATIRKHIKEATAAAAGMGVSDILYMKDFECGRNIIAKSLTSELYHDYIQYLIALRYLKNNGIKRREDIGIIQKWLVLVLR